MRWAVGDDTRFDKEVKSALARPGIALGEWLELLEKPNADRSAVVSDSMKCWRLSKVDKFALWVRSLELGKVKR